MEAPGDPATSNSASDAVMELVIDTCKNTCTHYVVYVRTTSMCVCMYNVCWIESGRG